MDTKHKKNSCIFDSNSRITFFNIQEILLFDFCISTSSMELLPILIDKVNGH